MKKKAEFQKLIDIFLNKIVETKSNKGEIYISAEAAVNTFMNLNQQIEEQREDMNRLSEELKKMKRELDLLIKELVKSGYIKISERRNLLKRNIVNQEALMNLLLKKKIISKKEISNVIKRFHNSSQTPKL
jgi:hypothetical protein